MCLISSLLYERIWKPVFDCDYSMYILLNKHVSITRFLNVNFWVILRERIAGQLKLNIRCLELSREHIRLNGLMKGKLNVHCWEFSAEYLGRSMKSSLIKRSRYISQFCYKRKIWLCVYETLYVLIFQG